ILEYKYTNSGTYQVMPIALGATNKVTIKYNEPANNDNLKAYGLYYQWGRKDPLGRAGALAATAEQLMTTYAGATGNTTYTLNDKEMSLVTLLGGDDVSEKELNGSIVPVDTWMIDYVTKNPTHFIFVLDSKYGNDWAGKTNQYLWGNPQGYDYPLNSTLHRTIFEPCPAGWRVAPKDLWMAFTDTDGARTVNAASEETWAENTINALNIDETTHTLTTATQRGLFFCYGVKDEYQKLWRQEPADFYPTSGYRHRTSGNIANIGTGYYWCSSPVSATTAPASFMYFGTTVVSPLDNYHRAFGCTIRCVKEAKN
ncbi:MAG: hypothetical protein NC250_03980, partial [Alistipes senegalensis]|nr:hypothetical protein [Bacteroides cellulosilyticus]MCM1351873.1 hypothetical protein [Alistipes senegalensis]